MLNGLQNSKLLLFTNSRFPRMRTTNSSALQKRIEPAQPLGLFIPNTVAEFKSNRFGTLSPGRPPSR
jgi:hypothetical protein